MTIGAGNIGSRSSNRSTKNAKHSTSKMRYGLYNTSITAGNSMLTGHQLYSSQTGCKSEIKHRFEITKKLGSGTYGKVSLAYDRKNEREVAVKLIKKSAIENKQDLVRIRREIRIMSALKHPHIIQIFEVFENKDKIILVMEYASGGELYDYVSSYGSLPEPEARRIFRQITSAVLYCHKNKVAHRDLKLENILLDANNNAKIADFGLSNYFSDKALLSTFCGSPLYASPEIINGTPYRGPEVDCWSLGILLYTLVYGSMPFDGRDFNRMVRQIKRGAYFEPDTPSTASMLIRNMLRVNPERRADIDEIASHWWLNLDENMPVIQELPENQIIDPTPLTDRAETMIVQDLSNESDVFMDFGNLSHSARLKIEEFRRRRKEAEECMENSQIKPPKARKTDSTELLTASEKCLHHDSRLNKEEEHERASVEEPDTYYESPERQRPLELRSLSKDNRTSITDSIPSVTSNLASTNSEIPHFKQPSSGTPNGCDSSSSKMTTRSDGVSPEQPDDPTTSNSKISYTSSEASSKPSFVPLDSERGDAAARVFHKSSAETWRLEIDSLNILMNQVLEQMERGPVNITLVARIKAHPCYDSRPMVKELLESIIAAQPQSVQKQASKLIQQQSQELIKRQLSTGTTTGVIEAAAAPSSIAGTVVEMTGRRNSKAYEIAKIDEKRLAGNYQASGATQQCNGQMRNFGERPWHSVEVGFDPDEDVECKVEASQSLSNNNDEAAEITVQDTSFEDVSDEEIILNGDRNLSEANLQDEDISQEDEKCDDEEDSSDEEEIEESDSEIDELGNEVEQVEDNANGSYRTTLSEVNYGASTESNPPPDPHNKFVDTFDRCLVKRQSKGKYQHSKVELYGRGVSTECESPTLPHRRIGGPQPTIERSPFLFDKAKEYIMTYPKPINDSSDAVPSKIGHKIVKNWPRTQDANVMVAGDRTPNSIERRICSAPQGSPSHIIKSDGEASESENERDQVADESEGEGNEEEECSEESEEHNMISKEQSGIPETASTVEVKKRNSQSIDLGTNATACDTEYQVKSDAVGDYDKNNIGFSLTAQRTKLGIRPLGVSLYDPPEAYFRRYNWDRRRRNRTIDTPENASKSIADHRDETTLNRYIPGHGVVATNDVVASASRATGTPNQCNSSGLITGASYGQSARCSDDGFRRAVEKDTVSPTRLNAGLNHNLHASRDDRRKSKSGHDISPDRSDFHTGSKLITPGSPNFGRYDNEPLAISQSWALEPKRFYVYQTRAEREAEKNTAVNNLHPSSTYRTTGSLWYSGCASIANHPISTHVTDYKSRYDDSYLHRRSNVYDFDGGTATASAAAASAATEISASIQNQGNHDSASIISHRYRSAGRHLASVFGDSTRRTYGRSNSVERSALRHEDLEHYAGYRNSVAKSDRNNSDKAEYSYVNFHDTNIRGSTPHEHDHSKLPTRGILKNKQNADNDSHASIEMSAANGQAGISSGKEQTSATTGKALKDEPSKAAKKRSLFLSLGRRRTTEVRLGADGKITVPGVETEFKRPSSPIDKIKSLFRRSKESVAVPTSSSNYSTHDSANFPSSSSARYGFTDKAYGVYPSSHLTPANTRDPFSPQYRKYTAAITTSSGNYNRNKYTTGTNDRTLRHRHEDPHMY